MAETCVTGRCTKEGKPCPVCGGPVPPSRGVKPRKYCCVKCLRLGTKGIAERNLQPHYCADCGTHVQYCGRGPRSVVKCDECRGRRSVQCEKCGVTFRGPRGRQFCSDRCRYGSLITDPIQCAACGSEFVREKGRHGSRYCSTACGELARKKNIENNVMASRLRAKTPQCLCCLRPFRRRSSGRNAGKYCSRECAFEARRLRLPCARLTNRIGASIDAKLAIWFHAWGDDDGDPKNAGCRRGGHKHRCRRYGCHYEPVSTKAIFERDNWTCQICGCELLRTRDHDGPWLPLPNTATIDHIVPLSFGPSSPGHCPSNIQAACWSCNSRKGNKPPDSFVPRMATSLD